MLEKWRKEELVNALTYKTLECEEHEWDNIPALVSHFIIHLEKYVSGLSTQASTFMAQEPTGELRADLEERIEQLRKISLQAKLEDVAEKSKMKIQTELNKDKIDFHRDKFE